MDPGYGLILFGVVFLGFIAMVGIVKARRKKERAYYISALVSLLMLLWSISIILNHFILAIVFLIAWVTVSIAGLPKIIQLMQQEPLKELQETDFSAPLRIRDLLTWKGWIRFSSSWGIRKTMCLYSILNMGGVGAIFFILSILGVINILWATVFIVLVGIGSPLFFYRQIGKTFK